MLTKLELVHKKTGSDESPIMNACMSQAGDEVLTDIWMDLGEIGFGCIRMEVRLGIEMQLSEEMGVF